MAQNTLCYTLHYIILNCNLFHILSEASNISLQYLNEKLFFMLVLLVEYIFLTTFYGLDFYHYIKQFLQVLTCFMVYSSAAHSGYYDSMGTQCTSPCDRRPSTGPPATCPGLIFKKNFDVSLTLSGPANPNLWYSNTGRLSEFFILSNLVKHTAQVC